MIWRDAEEGLVVNFYLNSAAASIIISLRHITKHNIAHRIHLSVYLSGFTGIVSEQAKHGEGKNGVHGV